MPIRAVTFDAGGTLIEPRPSVGRIYADVAAEHGFAPADPAEIGRRFARAWGDARNFDYGRTAWRAVAAEAFDLDRPDELVFFDALYERFAHPDVWRIHDDVIPVLETLRDASIRLAVLSNWDERLRPLLGRMNLAPWFSAITVSCEVGATKPDPAIFDRARQELDLPAHQILHVGDSRREDFEGARSAGWRAVLLDRSGAGEGTEAIRSLQELPARIGEWNRKTGPENRSDRRSD